MLYGMYCGLVSVLVSSLGKDMSVVVVVATEYKPCLCVGFYIGFMKGVL